MKECPVCGQKVGLDRIELHLKKVHPGEKVEIELDEEEKKQKKEAQRAYKPSARPKGKWVVLLTTIFIVFIIIAIIFVPRGLQIGDPPPPFTLNDTFNQPWNLDSHLGQGKPLLLEFFHPQCPACQQYAGNALWSLYNKYATQIIMVSIAIIWNSPTLPDPDVSSVTVFQNTYDAWWTFLIDDGTKVKDLYHVNYGIPMTYLINKEGKIADIHEGVMDFATLEGKVIPLL